MSATAPLDPPASTPFRRCALSCEGLSVRRGAQMVLANISLQIRCDECVTLLGPNGAGKTTLLLALQGLIAPERGGVWLRASLDAGNNRERVDKLDARRRGRLAALVPQSLEAVPPLRVVEVVAAARYPHLPLLGGLGPADLAVVEQAMAWCGITELRQRQFDQLSGGERQKTLLAAALAQDSQMLILDEPVTGLDPAYQAELSRLLVRWRASGRGAVVSSHDVLFAARLGGRVIALRDGQTLLDGPAEVVLTPSMLEQLYDTPFEAAATSSGPLPVPRWDRAAPPDRASTK